MLLSFCGAPAAESLSVRPLLSCTQPGFGVQDSSSTCQQVLAVAAEGQPCDLHTDHDAAALQGCIQRCTLSVHLSFVGVPELLEPVGRQRCLHALCWAAAAAQLPIAAAAALCSESSLSLAVEHPESSHTSQLVPITSCPL